MAGLAAKPALWIGVAAAATIPVASTIYARPKASLAAIRQLIGLNQPGGYWRLLAILFALLNLKSLPFGWHIRLTRALVQHVSFRRSYCPPAPPSQALFTPIITKTRCSLMEMDYNLHKSNSTYFSDLDISRMHLVACLFKRGLHKTHYKIGGPLLPDQKPGRFGIAFGGVQCSFRREIKPGQQVELWTRVLAWDQKWLYLITHFVEAGSEKPKGYWLQSWRKGSKKVKTEQNGATVGAGGKRVPHKAVMATAISKYVFKQGRITIPPEIALQGAELLPPKPSNVPDPSPQPSGAGTPSTSGDDLARATDTAANLFGILPSSTPATITSEEIAELGPPLEATLENWDWAAVERERVRGMKIAGHLAALDDAALVWSGAEGMALGEYA